MPANRREFLKVAAGTAVTAGLPLTGNASRTQTPPGTSAARGGTPGVCDAARARGLGLAVVNPQNWGMGSFEAIWIDPNTGERKARGDSRRCAMAEAV